MHIAANSHSHHVNNRFSFQPHSKGVLQRRDEEEEEEEEEVLLYRKHREADPIQSLSGGMKW